MEKSGILKYFTEIITSESLGVKKPNPKVFEFALNKANTIAENSIMIGDSYEADVMGALNSGMLAIHFNNVNTENSEVLSVNNLLELKNYL